MIKVCVLMPFRLLKDSRSIKTINVLNKFCEVDAYYLNYENTDQSYFNTNTKLFGLEQKSGLKNYFLKHTFFYNEYNYFSKEVLKRNIKYDYIWAHDLPVLKAALKIRKKTGGKVIYDCHEIYNETLNQFFPENAKGLKGILYKSTLNFMRHFGVRAESKMARKADICVTVGKYVKDFLENQFKINNIKVLYNCPYIQQNDKKVDLRTTLGFQKNDKILLYQGVMNQGRALPEMIQAQTHTNKNIKFVLMGDGPTKMILQDLVVELKLDNKVFFIDRVDSSVLLQYTRGADAGIVLQETEKNQSKNLGIANKFFEYIHAGIPFVATDAPENRLVYNKYKVCKLVNPKHNIIEIAQAIDSLFNDDLIKYKEASKKATAEYNWEAQAEKIRQIVK